MTSVEHHPAVGGRQRSAAASARDARARLAAEWIRDEGDGPQPRRSAAVKRIDRTRHSWGSGLGLALTKRLVEIHGGTIDVESELGGDTAFAVRIPVA
jgi:signal transduction histidine kinase